MLYENSDRSINKFEIIIPCALQSIFACFFDKVSNQYAVLNKLFHNVKTEKLLMEGVSGSGQPVILP